MMTLKELVEVEMKKMAKGVYTTPITQDIKEGVEKRLHEDPALDLLVKSYSESLSFLLSTLRNSPYWSDGAIRRTIEMAFVHFTQVWENAHEAFNKQISKP